jgi:hypothetical protein
VQVIPEHRRSQLSFTVPHDQLSTVLKLLLVDRHHQTGAGQAPVGAALDRARHEARPLDRPHHPTPATPADDASSEAFLQAPRVVVLTGAPATIRDVLESIGAHPDRILSPRQLRAEADSIHPAPATGTP